MTNIIFVAFDGSNGGNRGVEFTADFAKSSGADVLIAYVIEWLPYSFHSLVEL